MQKRGYVYMLTNANNRVLYIGVTSDLIKRVYEHKNSFVDGFSTTYNAKKLVYYEVFDRVEGAIVREKQLKAWRRQWKEELIAGFNPQWDELYDGLI